MKLAGAMLFVRDLAAMEAFYRDMVGLEPLEATRQPDYLEFGTGAPILALHQIPPAVAAKMPDTAGRPREASPMKLSFAVASLADEVARMRALGAELIERPWGGVDFVDPEGNIAALVTAE